MPKKAVYLTLSHCWGGYHVISLFERNQHAFQDNIPWNDLPKTFQDAILVARRLGFSYLWIDSLCIIQDSADDWGREAKLMGDIYKNAVCNIAASDGAHSSHGCFFPRQPQMLQPTMLPCTSGKQRYLVNETDLFDEHILYTRAWVLQEALLARRTLDCGRAQLFWRCGEMTASEVFPSGLPRHIANGNHPASKFHLRSSLEEEGRVIDINILEKLLRSKSEMSQLPIAPGKGSVSPNPSHSTFGLWATIVGLYTEMKLTEDTDRAVALSGIIDIFRPFFGTHYHGLWQIFMPFELLWMANGTSTKPSKRRAPSWSWMSFEGPMTYKNCKFQFGTDNLVTQFIGVEDKSHETRLRLSGPMLRARWRAERDSGPDKPAVITHLDEDAQMRFITGSYGNIYFDHWDEGMPAEDVVCMPITVIRHEYHPIWTKRLISGLVLQQKSNDVFVRLGYFEAREEEFMAPLKKSQRREATII